MSHHAPGIAHQRVVDDLHRTRDASLVPKPLGAPQHLGTRRRSPLAADYVPDPREDHVGVWSPSRSSPRAIGAHRRLTSRTVDAGASRWHGTELTELVIGTDQLSQTQTRERARSP